jgi:hypothetical protein
VKSLYPNWNDQDDKIAIANQGYLVYGITKGDGSGYNRTVLITNTKSKVGGAITNGEYRSQETKAST